MLNRRIITGDSKRFHEFDRGSCGGHYIKIIPSFSNFFFEKKFERQLDEETFRCLT